MKPRRLLTLLIAPIAVLAVACGTAATDEPTPGPDGEAPSTPERIEGIPDVTGWNTDWSNRTIDLRELRRGLFASDPRDIIPPIDNPNFESIAEADEWLDDREPVVLLQRGDEARAYPIRILTWHEIVNDEIAGEPVAVTYCPLCNSAVGFERTVDGQVLRFGVSGLLRNSDLVMWDEQTESLWQQITGEGIVGELAGTQLELIGVPMIAWADFKAGFPDGEVLSQDTGVGRNYGLNPYEGYDSQAQPFLFGGVVDERFPAMERVVGVTVGSVNKAYPYSVIAEERAVDDVVDGVAIAVLWGAPEQASALDVRDIAEGRAVGTGVAYLSTVDGQTLTFEPIDDHTYRDAETGSTWNILGQATDGPLAGTQLETAVHANHLWFAWAAFNEGSPVYGE
jgi:hypothetical protein